ncbi:MAG TPA: primosomal protein N', partial [Treponema sp.]|nr:primosomal protein N' [Treponema sp.]
MNRFLEVVFNVPVYQSFSYRSGDDCPQDVVGRRVEAQFGKRRIIGFVIGVSDTLPEACPLSEEKIKPIHRIIDSNPIFDSTLLNLARWVSSLYLCSLGEALGTMLPSGKREPPAEGSFIDETSFPSGELHLSEEQQKAVDGIINTDDTSPVYIYGVTGSGKTEVFLKAAETILSRGKNIMYLVPEIGLTHQVVEEIQNRFGSTAAVLHSGLTGSKRLAEWMRLLRGEARIVIGARSAVFAPIKNLGLIIIDEEHDGSYKSGTTPRYHSRQVAMNRCTDAGCPLVMGSATPSLEAWYQIKTGALRMFPLTARLAGGCPPSISIVPLGGSSGALSETLVREIREAKEAGRQSIIFLNRRGFTHFFRCTTCGYSMICKNCSVPLTLHRSQGVMKCHYCGWQIKPPSACPECKSLDIGYAGFGTEYIEEEVRSLFPRFSIERVDTDTMRGKGLLKKALDRFQRGETDILLGTQMVAKGLNFPGLRLVGIALADTGLHMPDFRAAERTFSLIVQVAGRAGRYFPDGRVIIQTWSPENPAIVYASQCDLEGFYEQELVHRKALGFPPFSRLVRLVFRSKKEQTVETG